MAENETLFLTWHDAVWTGVLNSANVLDYFMQRSNPFFDHTCNNEQIRMQRLSSDTLTRMTGVEYTLLHGNEPHLFVVRKQRRVSPTETQAVADYYILNGVVYASPDLRSLLSSRLASVAAYTHDALKATVEQVGFAPSSGYRWISSETETGEKSVKGRDVRDADQGVSRPDRASSTAFQRQRVDSLLRDFAAQFANLPPLANGTEVKREPDDSVSRAGSAAPPPPRTATPAGQNGAQRPTSSNLAALESAKNKEKRPRTAPKF